MTDVRPANRGSWVVIGCVVAVPLAIGIVLTVFLVQAFREADAEKHMPAADRERARTSALAAVTAYTTPLGRAYDALASKSAADFDALPRCSGVTLPNATQSHEAIAVYGPFLKRFARPAEAWTRADGPWTFLDDIGFAGHFEKNPRDQSFDEIRDAAARVADTYVPARYLVAIWPADESANRLSVRTTLEPENTLRAGDHYAPGEFHGWVVVIDQTTGGIVCAGPIAVTGSATILHRHNEPFPHPLHTKYVVYDAEKDAAKEVAADFEKNFKRAVESAMPRGLTAQLGFGPLF